MSRVEYSVCNLCGHRSPNYRDFDDGVKFSLAKRAPNASGGEVDVEVDVIWNDNGLQRADLCKACRDFLRVPIEAAIRTRWDGKRSYER